MNDLRYKFNVYTSYPRKPDGVIVSAPPTAPLLFGKFKDAGFAPSHGNDYPIYRFADALLIYAETASQANGAPTAQDYALADATTKEAFRALVLKERAYEFLCEGKRWFDLVRTKTVKQVIKDAKGIDVPDYFMLFAIPKNEIDNNPDIDIDDQNPGY